MKKALVTGASGFIGRALCECLVAEGVMVRAVFRRPIEGPWHEAHHLDLLDEAVPRHLFEDVDVVFHLAAQVHAVTELNHDEADYHRANVTVTEMVLVLAAAAGVERLVNFSSVKAMGEGGLRVGTEADRPSPVTAYGKSKLRAEQAVAAAQDIETVNLRLPMTYGKGCRGNLDRMMRAMLKRRFPPLPDNNNRRSMVHVRNVVEAALAAATAPLASSGETYIVTDGQDYSTAYLQARMREVLGYAEPGWAVPIPILRSATWCGDRLRSVFGTRVGIDTGSLDKLLGSARYNSEKISRELGYEPIHTLSQGLADMYAAICEVDPNKGAQ